ncbi:MAG: ABC transporter ATP-binding protein [Pseudomonadota bacterium]
MMSLVVENLSKRFKSETVLDDVCLDVPTGRTLVLFGPSGTGKTVLLRCIAGAEEPEAGTIRINGEDVTDLPPESRGVGMAFQNFALFPHMSAFDNIASPLTAQRSTRDRIREGVDAVARLLKIDHVLGHAPRALSNGQKQRTALARALVAEPDILLLDDPLRNVDAKLRFEMRLELPRLLADRGATVIYVTQDYKEAMALGDQIAVLEGQRIAQIGTPEEIYLRPASVDIANHFGDPSINLLDVLPGGDGTGTHVEISGQRVALPQGYEGAHGQDCVLGIRPEALRFTTGAGVPVTVEAETPLNEKTVTLAVTAGGREILISRPAGTMAPASGAAHVEMDAGSVILFDRATGQRISPASAGATGEQAA